MVDASNKLNEAYELIEAGNMTDALTVLDDIKAEYSQNADYWWLYAHATDDEAEGQAALRRVLELDANYPGATVLAEQVGIETPKPVQSIRSLKPPPAPPVTNPNLPSTADIDALDDDIDFDDEFASTAPSGGNRTAIVAMSLFVIILSIVAIVILLPSIFGGGDDEPTEVANVTQVDPQAAATEDPFLSTATALVLQATQDVATELASTSDTDAESTSEVDPFSLTATALIVSATEAVENAIASQTEAASDNEMSTEEVVATEEPTEDVVVTEEATDDIANEEPTSEETEPATEEVMATDESPADDFDSLITDLAEFDVPEDGILIEETSLGNTLIAQTCVPRGPRANAAINGILTTLAEQSDVIADDIEGIAVSIIDCATDTRLNVLGIDREAFDGLVSGDLTIGDIRSMLQLIG